MWFLERNLHNPQSNGPSAQCTTLPLVPTLQKISKQLQILQNLVHPQPPLTSDPVCHHVVTMIPPPPITSPLLDAPHNIVVGLTVALTAMIAIVMINPTNVLLACATTVTMLVTMMLWPTTLVRLIILATLLCPLIQSRTLLMALLVPVQTIWNGTLSHMRIPLILFTVMGMGIAKIQKQYCYQDYKSDKESYIGQSPQQTCPPNLTSGFIPTPKPRNTAIGIIPDQINNPQLG